MRVRQLLAAAGLAAGAGRAAAPSPTLTWSDPVVINTTRGNPRDADCWLASGGIVGFPSGSAGRLGTVVVSVGRVCGEWTGGCDYRNCSRAFASTDHGRSYAYVGEGQPRGFPGTLLPGAGGGAGVVMLNQSTFSPWDPRHPHAPVTAATYAVNASAAQGLRFAPAGRVTFATVQQTTLANGSFGCLAEAAAAPTPGPLLSANSNMGNILKLASGRWLSFWSGQIAASSRGCGCPWWGGRFAKPWCCGSMEFFDSGDGRTWRYLSTFSGKDLDLSLGPTNGPGPDSSAVQLPSGRILFVVRMVPCGVALTKTHSDDQGRSWSRGVDFPVIGTGESLAPAHTAPELCSC